MEKDGLISIFNLAEKKNNLIDLLELFSNRVTYECLATFNFDGSMRKTQKSKALEKCNMSPTANCPREYVCLVEMSFIWRLATPTPADREIVRRYGSEYTWGDFGRKVVSMIASRHSSATKIVCVNDVCNLKYTIKDDERDRRSKNLKNIPNIPIKSAGKFPSSTQFTSILSNSSNKVRLQQLIEMRLKEYSSITVKEIIQCTGLSAKNLFNGINIDEFGLTHVEADTVIFTIYNKTRENEWKGNVVIDAEDTDIYVQVAYVSQKVSGKLLIKKKNIHVDSRTLFTTAMAHVIIQSHVMTGFDYNCGLYGHGRKAVIKKVMKTSEAIVLLYECGDALPSPAHVLNNFKTFLIKYIHGSKELGCAETRATQWEK